MLYDDRSLQNIGTMEKATMELKQSLVWPIEEKRTMILFCNVTPRSLRGWNNFGIGAPLGCGSEAVPAGGTWAGV